MRIHKMIVLLFFISTSPSLTCAGDWPQILGPHRDGRAENEKLADGWPKGGPAVAWKKPLGQGYAGVAVVGKVGVVYHREGDVDVAEAFSVADGKPVWTKTFPTTFVAQVSQDSGPRCVPVIDGGHVYLFSSQGVLRCLSFKSGDVIWERKTHEDYKAREGYFGAGSTPIVVGDKVIVNVGGDRQEAGVVAFSTKTGETIWKALKEQPSYSAPILVKKSGVPHLIVITRLSVASLDPETGAVRFSFPFGQTGPTVNAASPVVLSSGELLLTASYGIGAVLSNFDDRTVTETWSSDDILSSQYSTPIEYQGAVYGLDGRQDGGQSTLRCFDPLSQKIHWSAPAPGYLTMILADDKLIAVTAQGEVLLISPNQEAFKVLGKFKLFNGNDRDPCSLPALSNG
ncbi:MAG: PQQ-binding-like beta-propeller repeat protein, partial [Planctomycetaceae bacterium]